MVLPSSGERVAEPDVTDLRPTDVKAVACATSTAASISSPTKARPGWSLRRISASRPDEVVGLRFQRHGKADPGLERVGLVGKVLPRKDQPRLDPHMSSAARPIGSMPNAAPAWHTASYNATASLGWQKIS